MDLSVRLDMQGMQEAADRACQLLKVLAHRDRLMLMCELSQGERCVGELEATLDIRQPSLSQQLGVLRDSGLVLTRREGKNIFYSIQSGQALAVMAVLHEQFCPEAESATGLGET